MEESSGFQPGGTDAAASAGEPASGIVKRCVCGCSYDRLAWAELTLLGVQHGPREELELRLCRGCGSSIAIKAARP